MRKASGQFTKGQKGFYRWYKGKTRWVCGLDATLEEVEDLWKKKRDAINADTPLMIQPTIGSKTLREAISDFLTAAEHRQKTGKPTPLSARMLHNYAVDLNHFGAFTCGDTPIGEIGPDQFTAYAQSISNRAASGYDSTVAHICTLFRYCVSNESLERVRFGTQFKRRHKGEVRDQRIAKPISFTPEEVAKLIDNAGGAMKPMIMLGICGALNNSEAAWLDRACVDLKEGVIDFRRRKTGRVRRVIPLPLEVVSELQKYARPNPADEAYSSLFFLTDAGLPYVRMTDAAQANTISVLFARLANDCEIKKPEDGRGFKGLRTTFTNLAPPNYREEIELITGHARGTILLDHYLENVGLDRLKHVVDFVWGQVMQFRASTSPDGGAASSGPASSSPVVHKSAS